MEDEIFRYLCNQRNAIFSLDKTTKEPKEVNCHNCKKILNSIINKEEIKFKRKDYLHKWNISHRKQQSQNVKNWNKKNHKKRLETIRKDKENNKEKYKSRAYANNIGLRGNFCERCESKENLHFHHTDYAQNKGFTVCAVCHKAIHKAEVIIL